MKDNDFYMSSEDIQRINDKYDERMMRHRERAMLKRKYEDGVNGFRNKEEHLTTLKVFDFFFTKTLIGGFIGGLLGITLFLGVLIGASCLGVLAGVVLVGSIYFFYQLGVHPIVLFFITISLGLLFSFLYLKYKHKLKFKRRIKKIKKKYRNRSHR